MLGKLESIWRYPVKSMRGEEVDEIFVAFTGLMGDRVYAVSSTAAPKAFPWHTARELEDYVLYQARFKEREGTLKPDNLEEAMGHPANIHAPFPTGADAFAVEVETPDGAVVDIGDPAFLEGLKDKSEGDLALHHTQRNIVDCRPVTLFSLQTVGQLSQETGTDIHKLQFRANFYVDWDDGETLLECMLSQCLDPAHSCKDAHCGSCMAIRKSGQVAMHKSTILSKRDKERGYILLCQAVPQSPDVWVDCDA